MKLKFERKTVISAAGVLVAGVLAVSTVVLAAGGPTGGGGGMGGPGGDAGNMGQVEMSESVITVKLEAPSVGSLSRTTEFIGKIEPGESVSVYPETSGKVTKVYFEAGDTVEAGDLLFELDDSDAQLAYQIAEASYNKTTINVDTTLGSNYESSLLSAESSLKSAQQSLNSARQNLSDYNDDSSDELLVAQKKMDAAKLDMDNAQAAYDASNSESDKLKLEAAEAAYSLARSNYNDADNDSDPELRSLRNSYQSAQNNYNAALDKFNLLQGGSRADTEAAADADLTSAGLSLQKSAKELDKYKVYAPIGGLIESKGIDVYETVGSNTVAYTISSKNAMSVSFNASADAATALALGDEVTVTKGTTAYTALITSIDSRANETTGLFPIEAQIQDDDGSLLSGVSVKVTAATQKVEDALLVPIDIVYYDEGQAYVFTYSDGKAVRTDITTGMSNSETIVAEDGVTADSQMITTWHPDLKDGATVHLAEGQTDPATGAVATDSTAADSAAAPAADTADKQEG